MFAAFSIHRLAHGFKGFPFRRRKRRGRKNKEIIRENKEKTRKNKEKPCRRRAGFFVGIMFNFDRMHLRGVQGGALNIALGCKLGPGMHPTRYYSHD